jgi:hypothetical protein
LTLNYGTGNPFNTNMVPLVWSSIELASDHDPRILSLSDEHGLYLFEGRHDAHPSGCVLYLGLAEKQSITKEAVAQLKRHLFWHDKASNDNTVYGFYADVWNVTVRWAEVYHVPLIPSIEQLLIAAHAPPLNSQGVRNAQNLSDDALDLIVMNGGKKGRLLPSVVGKYYDLSSWGQR